MISSRGVVCGGGDKQANVFLRGRKKVVFQMFEKIKTRKLTARESGFPAGGVFLLV
jgi:hypothetical protein